MKSLNYILAVAASLAFFSSCSNDTDDSVIKDVKVEKTFGISSPESDTRAFIYGFDKNRGSQDVYWGEDDHITIIADGHTTGDTFDFVSYGQPHNNAVFKGWTYDVTDYWAVYPAQPNAELTTEGYLTVKIPSEQKAINGTFDPAAAVQIGYAKSKKGFGLLHVCAFFVVTIGENCKKAELEAKNPDWHVAGTVTADPKSAGTPIKRFGSDCTSKIKLTDIPAEGGVFFIAFIPSNTAPELEFTVDYGGGPQVKPLTSNTQFQASKIYDLGSY